MRTIKILIAATILSQSLSAVSQTWCTPPTGTFGNCQCINTYGPASPVITNVTFGSINRNSTASQKELYVNTGVSATVLQGQSIAFSITYTKDVQICPTYNIRVWIDWNIDGIFDGSEEEVTLDMQTATTLTATITVPASAGIGTTRMRVSMKMSSQGGHTMPDPCLVTDPATFGWHGEVEDYTLVVTPANNVGDNISITAFNVFPNPTSDLLQISYQLKQSSDVKMLLINPLGQILYEQEAPDAAGVHSVKIDLRNYPAGIYNIILDSEKNHLVARKIIIEK